MEASNAVLSTIRVFEDHLVSFASEAFAPRWYAVRFHRHFRVGHLRAGLIVFHLNHVDALKVDREIADLFVHCGGGERALVDDVIDYWQKKQKVGVFI